MKKMTKSYTPPITKESLEKLILGIKEILDKDVNRDLIIDEIKKKIKEIK